MTGADPALSPELAEALAGWRDRGRLSNEAVRALRSRRRHTTAGVAGGVAVLLLATGIVRSWPVPTPDRIATLSTARGEVRTVRLPDGTTLRLDGATSIAVRYGTETREVTLASGAAFFDVTHDPTRPFTVRAGDGNIRVLGTAFDVDRTAGQMDVAVYRGAVRLAGENDTRGKMVPAGWRRHVIRGHAGPPVRFPAQTGDRLHDWLDVDGLRLADLVTILNRRAGPMIMQPPAPLADLAISGRFRTDDRRSLIEALGLSYDFNVHQRGDTWIITSK